MSVTGSIVRALVCGAILLVVSPAMVEAQSAAGTPPPGSITVVWGGRSSVLTPAELAKLPRKEVSLVEEEGEAPVTLSGVNLWDVMQRAGTTLAEASGRQRAMIYVRLRGSDGQNALLALAEVDPGYTRRTVLLADHRNGKLLDEFEGPWRLIIPDDLRHARWIRGLVTVEVGTLRP